MGKSVRPFFLLASSETAVGVPNEQSGAQIVIYLRRKTHRPVSRVGKTQQPEAATEPHLGQRPPVPVIVARIEIKPITH